MLPIDPVLRTLCIQFIDHLHKHRLMNHPGVFIALEDAAKEKGYKIRAAQKGIHGTELSFEYEGRVL